MRAVSSGARAGAVLWILGVQTFFVEYFVQRAYRPSYSIAHDYVSDLGAVHCSAQLCSPLHAWLNASFVLQGVLILGGVFLLRHECPPLPESSVALAFMSLCGVGVIIAGMVPGDVHYIRHIAAGTMVFASGSLAMMLFGMVMLNGPLSRRLAGWSSIGGGILVAVATVLLQWRHGDGHGLIPRYIGVIERVPAYGIPLWVAAMGVRLLSRRESEGRL